MQVVPLPGRHSGVLVIHSDVSADKQREQEWRRRALHDPLTGLANRALLADRLDHAVAGSARDPRSLAVLFIDLDHFKLVNDRFGHDAGDQVLREAARRFAGSVRAADTVGRWGGDEFLVVAERLTGDSTAEDLAARLAASLDTPIRTDAGEFRVAASVGIAYLDQHQHADQLIRAADEQLQTGRHLRRNLPSAPRPREPVPVG
jgi:diguanylate cyclase (GGDEF)-like protein